MSSSHTAGWVYGCITERAKASVNWLYITGVMCKTLTMISVLTVVYRLNFGLMLLYTPYSYICCHNFIVFTKCGPVVITKLRSLMVKTIYNKLFYAVPGITGSQLDVRHDGITLCNTLGLNVGLWVSEVRALKIGCFIPEMT